MKALHLSLRAACCAILAAVAGCGATTSDADPGEAGTSLGPWTAEMEQVSMSSRSDFAAAVFADGRISEQELVEAQQVAQDCFAAEGLTASWDSYGYVSVEGPNLTGDAPPEAMGTCSFADGGVMQMYYQMMVNPENEDAMALRADCLVSAGLVGAGFAGHDLESALERDAPLWAPGDETARLCMLDPLGLVAAGPAR